MHKRIKSIIATTLSTVMVLSLTNSIIPKTVKAEERNEIIIKEILKDSGTSINQLDPNEIVRVIVRLKDAPAAKSNKSMVQVMSEQETVQEKAMRIAKTNNIVHSFSYLINGFSLDIKRGEIKKLEQLPEVEYVEEAEQYTLDMKNAKELTQAYDVWNTLGKKGEGMVVAVIDSGIDTNHKDMRISDTTKPKWTEIKMKDKLKEGTLNGKGKFYTNKIPYAYNYADNNDDVIDIVPESGAHGLHVAGIIGANASDKEVKELTGVQGVAPECQIIAMKVFSNKGGKAGGDTVVKAIDDAAALGVDVINMSLGHAAGFQGNDYNRPNKTGRSQHEAIEAAVNTGVTVVCSAGNESFSTFPNRFNDCPDTGVVGSPGIAEAALQVASYENTKITNNGLTYKNGAESGSIILNTSEIDPTNILKDEYKLVDCGLGKPEDFTGKDLKGKIALIKRGELNYVDKKLNAQAAGAIGCIVYNKDGDESLVGMAEDEKVKIPVVFVANSDGKKLSEVVKNEGTIKFCGIIELDNKVSNDMSDFSSWGPAPNLAFKPQIMAPGGNIYSTVNYSKHTNMGGTSMSSPHVAGSEALIAQAVAEAIENKTLRFASQREKVEFIKNSAIVTALPMMDKYHANTPYSPRRQGAGMIQTKNAIENKVMIRDEKGSSTLALGEIGEETNIKLTLKNYSNSEITYKASTIGNGVFTEDNVASTTTNNTNFPYDVKINGAEVKFDNEIVKVKPNSETVVNVTVKLPKGLTTERFVEGFIRFEDEAKKAPAIGTPFVGFYGNWSKPQIIDAPCWDNNAHIKLGNMTGISVLSGKLLTTQLGAKGKDAKGNLIVDPKNIAISPNKDNFYDSVVPNLVMLRGAGEVTGQVVNDKGEVVRTLPVQKYANKSVMTKEELKTRILADLLWDGKDNNNKVVPEGQYYFKLSSKVHYEKAQEQQYNSELPVKIDITKPVIELKSPTIAKSKNYVLKWTAKDNLVGINNPGSIYVNDTKNSLKNPVITEENGIYSTPITLVNGKNVVSIVSSDYAMNIEVKDFEITVDEKAQNTGVVVTLKESKIEGDQAKAIFTAVNNTVNKQDVTLILAAYDKNNKFLNYEFVKKNINAGETLDLSGMIKLLPGATKVKCFVWDSLENMKPLTKAVEIPVSK